MNKNSRAALLVQLASERCNTENFCNQDAKKMLMIKRKLSIILGSLFIFCVHLF